MLLCINLFSQQYCSDYTEAKNRLNNEKLRFNSRPTLLNRNTVKSQALITANLMEKCFESRPSNDPSVILERQYRLGKVFGDAELWKQARNYFATVKNDPESKRYTYKGQTFYSVSVEMIKALPSGLIASNTTGNGVVRVTYSGKGGYSEEIREAITFDTNDNFSFTSDELEELMQRRRRISAGAPREYLVDLSRNANSDDWVVEGPFIVINGNSEKSGRDTQENGQTQSQVQQRYASQEPVGGYPKSKSLESRYASTLNELYNHFASLYINKNPKHYIPVYLSSASFSGEGYKEFSNFARGIHRRGAGGRVAYFNSIDNSIVCWISTGGGTLNHEAVHALLAEDYPGIPGWLNEGIASMYEETSSYQPLDNYRLIHLKYAMDYGVFPSLNQLLSTEDESYDGKEETMLYAAAARYLSIYLLENGLLPTTYKQIRDARNQSASERKSIILSNMGMSEAAFNQAWRSWVIDRRVPEKWTGLSGQIRKYIQSLSNETIGKISTKNSATFLESSNGHNWYSWSIFIDADQSTLDQVKYVQYVLHPSFQNNVINVYEGSSKGFPLYRRGWGTFKVKVNVFFKDGSSQKLSHDLKFR